MEGPLSRYTVKHRLADSVILWSPRQSRGHPFIPPPPPPRYGHTTYGVFSLTWRPASMQIYWNKRKCLHKKGVQLPQDWFGTQTWPPFHCFGTPIWPPRRHVKALYYGHRKPTRHTITPIIRTYRCCNHPTIMIGHPDNTDTPLFNGHPVNTDNSLLRSPR